MSQYVHLLVLLHSITHVKKKNIIQCIKTTCYTDQQLAGNNVKKLLPFLVHLRSILFCDHRTMSPIEYKIFVFFFFQIKKNKN